MNSSSIGAIIGIASIVMIALAVGSYKGTGVIGSAPTMSPRKSSRRSKRSNA